MGRRIAFDAERGRLWVVCPRCRRWNLAPLEERWEVLEDCERIFPRHGMLASSDNVSLARLDDGMEMVRIGRPERRELAFWRYGDQLVRRMKRASFRSNVSSAVGLGLAFAGSRVPGGQVAYYGAGAAWRFYDSRLRITRVPVPGGGTLALRGEAVKEVSFDDVDETGRWELRVPHTRGVSYFSGYAAVAAARPLLARINHLGGSVKTVDAAVERIDRAGGVASYFGSVAEKVLRLRDRSGFDEVTLMARLPGEVLLSLEMACSEQSEQHALQQELAGLQSEWRHAEEVAGIADSLFLADGEGGDVPGSGGKGRP
ncbi:MAG TPA: hypothetical protein VFE05_24185 [Longimicrobiaceae bacterium]|nr:hypothetical protein [Longimicrobiaceae bacterium]